MAPAGEGVMRRRAFLELLVAAAAGLAVDPERLLWTPRTLITVPAMPDARTLTLIDWARRIDPDGRIDAIVDLLMHSNELLESVPWQASR
jgi:hypothetical protein